MALDYGRRRIGIAVSDPTRTIASPGGVIELERRRGRGPILPPPALLARLEEIRPSRVLMGIPLDMDGRAGAMAREVRAFAAALEAETGIEIVEWDERLTSARAEREIAALQPRRSRRREKGRTDEMAATLMLTDYLRSAS